MDEFEYKRIVSAALRAEIPPDANHKAWFGRQSVYLDCSEQMLRQYAAGDVKVPGWLLLNMFEHFGAGFERHIRGEPAEVIPIKDILALVEKHKRGKVS